MKDILFINKNSGYIVHSDRNISLEDMFCFFDERDEKISDGYIFISIKEEARKVLNLIKIKAKLKVYAVRISAGKVERETIMKIKNQSFDFKWVEEQLFEPCS